MAEEVESCLVCCEDLRVAAVASCNHRGVCALCSVRLRQVLSLLVFSAGHSTRSQS